MIECIEVIKINRADTDNDYFLEDPSFKYYFLEVIMGMCFVLLLFISLLVYVLFDNILIVIIPFIISYTLFIYFCLRDKILENEYFCEYKTFITFDPLYILHKLSEKYYIVNCDDVKSIIKQLKIKR